MTKSLSFLSALILGCGSQVPDADPTQPPTSSLAGTAGETGAAGSAGTAGVAGAAGEAGIHDAGEAGSAGATAGPLVELPQELTATYPSADAPRSCLLMVTLDDEATPTPIQDGGVGNAIAADAGAEAAQDPDHRPLAPQLLSQTGCFADIAQHQVSAEFVPYLMRSPLWTDSAHKDRFFSVPLGTTITRTPNGTWDWPIGSVLLKNFSFDFQGSSGVERRPVETRLMKRFPDGRWQYWSYRWNELGSDATLLEDAVETDLTVVGQPNPVRYVYPSELSCRTCHGFQTEGVLGPTAMQLDLEISTQGLVRRQLDLLSELGVIERQEAPPSELVNPANETATLEARARSYLHGNCAHCHHPGGYAPPDVLMDLRITTPLRDAELCGAEVDYSSSTARWRIAPGNLAESDLWQRFTSDGLWRMPVIGTGLHDPLGEQVIRDWIESLESCPQ
jgi:uncharacterized repeat protein (TIGR03806 family)